MNEDNNLGGAAEARISRLETESVDVADSLRDLTSLWLGIHEHRKVVDHKLGTMDGMLVQVSKAIVDLGVGQEEIIEDVRGLRGEVGSLRGDVADVRSEVDTVRTDVRGLRCDLGAFREATDFRFGRLEGEIRQVKDEVAVLTTDVAELKSDVAVLKTDVAGLKTDVAGLKTDMVDVKEMLGQVLVRLPKPRSRTGRNAPDWEASPASAAQAR